MSVLNQDRALLVDDSRVIQMILSRIFVEIGYEPVVAGDVDEALALLEQTGPLVLAVLDWNLPGRSGLDLVKILRADARYDSMKILMVTTEMEPVQRDRAQRAGINGYLTKPFTSEGLVEKMKELGICGTGHT